MAHEPYSLTADSDRPPHRAPAWGAPQVEVVTRPGGEPEPPLPWYRAHRMRVFLSVFLVVLVAGLAWDFLRPAQYRASATVRTLATPVTGANPIEPMSAVENASIQGRVLLGREVIEEALRRGGGEAGLGVADTDALAAMLEVAPLPDTNLVELAAVGGEPLRLAAAVNAWIDAYLDLRRRKVAEEVEEAESALREEHEALAAAIADKRGALERFRADNDIVTMERDGNVALARLRSLNADLNRARDEAVEAEARLAAAEEAIARGEPVVPPSEQRALEDLEARVIDLRARLTELSKRFTPFYLENEPDTKIIPAQLAELEAKIAEKIEQGRAVVLTRARQEVSQARRRVQVLEQDLAEVEQEAGRFTAGFAEYESLQAQLARLEELHRDAGSRLAEIQAKDLAEYPAVEVIEPAHPPARPFKPDYWRDALWVLLAASIAAFGAVVLLEFLTRRPRRDEGQAPFTGVRVYTTNGAAAMTPPPPGPTLEQGQPAPRIPQSASPAQLPQAQPREPILAEIAALWALADPLSRQFIALLLSGLTARECAALTAADFAPDAAQVHVPANPPREVPLAGAVRPLFTASQPLPLWAGADRPLNEDELSARLGLLAHDAGLNRPEEISPEALRHAYVAFLVRQGARLTELPQLIGDMPASRLGRYAAYSPGGAARPLAEVDLVHPLFRGPEPAASAG